MRSLKVEGVSPENLLDFWTPRFEIAASNQQSLALFSIFWKLNMSKESTYGWLIPTFGCNYLKLGNPMMLIMAYQWKCI